VRPHVAMAAGASAGASAPSNQMPRFPFRLIFTEHSVKLRQKRPWSLGAVEPWSVKHAKTLSTSLSSARAGIATGSCSTLQYGPELASNKSWVDWYLFWVFFSFFSFWFHYWVFLNVCPKNHVTAAISELALPSERKQQQQQQKDTGVKLA